MRHGKKIERQILDNANFKYELPNALAWGWAKGGMVL